MSVYCDYACYTGASCTRYPYQRSNLCVIHLGSEYRCMADGCGIILNLWESLMSGVCKFHREDYKVKI